MAATYSYVLNGDTGLVARTKINDGFDSVISELDTLSPASKTFITLTDAATISWTYSLGYNAKVTLGGDRSLSISGATSGDYGTLIVTQGPAGNYVINFGANDKFASGTYSFSTTGTQSDIFTWVYDGSNFYWNYNSNFS